VKKHSRDHWLESGIRNFALRVFIERESLDGEISGDTGQRHNLLVVELLRPEVGHWFRRRNAGHIRFGQSCFFFFHLVLLDPRSVAAPSLLFIFFGAFLLSNFRFVYSCFISTSSLPALSVLFLVLELKED